MKVKELYNSLGELIYSGKGNYDVMIKLDGEDSRDLINSFGKVYTYNSGGRPTGYVELESINKIDWKRGR